MAKQIKLTYKDQEYTLEYSRRTVKMMEENGFRVDEFDAMPTTMIERLVEGAFLMHHRTLPQTTIDEIYYKGVYDKEGFIAALSEMFAEPMNALLADPDGDKPKNAGWTKSW